MHGHREHVAAPKVGWGRAPDGACAPPAPPGRGAAGAAARGSEAVWARIFRDRHGRPMRRLLSSSTNAAPHQSFFICAVPTVFSSASNFEELRSAQWQLQ
ncbi:unnamed protein product [Prorocentrum cordatum]|uniref:Uncharacterized protein n=1 Tax=Prorocentrum cordatum TaxID=2364126 RepID=A0ABN9QA15_9DINO|nr:unnamed protein product [Polarella glacialis]